MKIDGKKIADKILSKLKQKIEKLKKRNIYPKLAIILVGDDPSSYSYVKRKKIKAKEIGIKTIIKRFSSGISQKELLTAIQQFNKNKSIHGIIVQQPFPSHIDQGKIVSAIIPEKDVDGFHLQSKLQPPISLAVSEILKFESLKNKKVVVVGKGETGGEPIINSFKKMGINPTVIDSKTEKPETLTKNADIIISAVGKSNTIRPNMLKKGVVLISIGLHKGPDGKLHGDYEENEIKNIASFYTPTPGGVGPVNVAMLLKNLLTACENFNR